MAKASADKHKIVSQREWLAARKALLAKEKEFTKQRDRLSEERRALPWVKIEKSYSFEGPKGRQSLSDLFEGRGQLIVYHFMYGPEWGEGCMSCSFWADTFNGAIEHLKARDVTMIAVSRAPYSTLKAFQKRMGWSFKWVSSLGSDFNYDFHVSFTPEEQEKGPVFYKDKAGDIFHTYSTYARGLDAMNGAYQLLDLAPKGRDEAELPWPMAWVKHRDKYGA